MIPELDPTLDELTLAEAHGIARALIPNTSIDPGWVEFLDVLAGRLAPTDASIRIWETVLDECEEVARAAAEDQIPMPAVRCPRCNSFGNIFACSDHACPMGKRRMPAHDENKENWREGSIADGMRRYTRRTRP